MHFFVYIDDRQYTHHGEKTVLEMGASFLCVMNPYTQNFAKATKYYCVTPFMVFIVIYYLKLNNTTIFYYIISIQPIQSL